MSTATPAVIKGWFEWGEKCGATHMVVKCDEFDFEDFPAYVMPGEDVAAATQSSNSMERTLEVYKIALGWDAQSEGRAWNVH